MSCFATDQRGQPRTGTVEPCDIGAYEVGDADSDTIVDVNDNCPATANTNQANNDADAQGDACDPDDDNDTVADGSDNCPVTANTNQANNDADAQGDACDPDDDNDGVLDTADGCPTQAGPASNVGCPPVALTPPITTTTPAPTFNLASAIKRCKKKFPKGPKRKRCIRKAKARAGA
jgi:hypothetical protein